jgi:hypothetical protein
MWPRSRVFISYPRAERGTAESVALRLSAWNYRVFYDQHDLVAAEEFDRRIASEVAGSDIFVFFITPAAVAQQHYTLTELGHAQRKWRHPQGRVLPVMLRPTALQSIPAYLRAVTILEPRGDPAAEVAQEVRRLAVKLGLVSRVCGKLRQPLVAALAVLLGAVAAVTCYYRFGPRSTVIVVPESGDASPARANQEATTGSGAVTLDTLRR